MSGRRRNQKESEEAQQIKKDLTKFFNSKIDTLRCRFEQELSAVRTELEELKRENNELRSNSGNGIVARMLDVERSVEFYSEETSKVTNDLNDKVDRCILTQVSLANTLDAISNQLNELIDSVIKIEETQSKDKKLQQEILQSIQELREENDALQQYSRRETLVINNVPMKRNEDTLKVALDFIWYNLGIDINRQQVSTCHRNYPPSHLYTENCPPIYVKFVIRDLKRDCLKRKFRLRGKTNEYGDQFYIYENLTLFRRNLLEEVKKELHYWKFVWTKNGNIMARKDSTSKVVKINTYRALDLLLDEEGEISNYY